MQIVEIVIGAALLLGAIQVLIHRREAGASIHRYYENLSQRRKRVFPGWLSVGIVPGTRLSEWMALALAAIGLAMGAAMVIASVK